MLLNLPILLLGVLGLPLLGGLLAWGLGKDRGRWGVGLSAGSLCAAAVLAVLLWVEVWQSDWPARHLELHWFGLEGGAQFVLGLWLDRVSVAMLALVTGISAVVALFGGAYFAQDPHQPRFAATLGLFVLAMQGLVLANNLVLLFVCWELVGVCSWLLISYYRSLPEAGPNANWAFLLNRIGDAGLLVGIGVLLAVFGTTQIDQLRQLMQGTSLADGQWQVVLRTATGSSFSRTAIDGYWLHIASGGLLLGMLSKSAQLPFSMWLPRAMVGPTPVSALLHAATMVVAGVYLLVRLAPLMSPEVLAVGVVLGVATAAFAAAAAAFQFNLKRLLAYSTLSQIGLMFAAAAAWGLPEAVGHLFSHAFYKAGLFLCAGALSLVAIRWKTKQNLPTKPDLLDIRNLGGLWRLAPWLAVPLLGFALALAGVPFTSGGLTKENILGVLWSWSSIQAPLLGSWTWVVGLLGILTALLTAIYTARLLWFVLPGPLRVGRALGSIVPQPGMWRRLPWLAVLPLWLLLPGATVFWLSFNPFAGLDVPFLQMLPRPLPCLPAEPGSATSLLQIVTDIRQGAVAAHGWLSAVAVGVLLLGFGAVGYAWRSGRLLRLEAASPVPGLAVFAQFLYLDTLWLGLARLGRACAKGASWIEHRLLFPLVQGIGAAVGGGRLLTRTYGLAQLAHWLDTHLLDGIVNGIGNSLYASGRRIASLQVGRVQAYVLWVGVLALALLWWCLLD
jgi:NADH-quinone oxidoreductase subunit L